MQAFRIESMVRNVLGVPRHPADRYVASSIIDNTAYDVALESLMTRYTTHKPEIDGFIARNKHLQGIRFSGESDQRLEVLANDLRKTLTEIGALKS